MKQIAKYLIISVLLLAFLDACHSENQDRQTGSQSESAAQAQSGHDQIQGTDPGTEIFEGTGTVISIPPGKRHIVVRHGDIPGFMNAMTMPIPVQDTTMLRHVSPQDSIWFEIEWRGNEHIILRKLERITQPQDEAETTFLGNIPDHKFDIAAGEVINISDFHGQVLMINFWATWCGPCRREIPELIRLKEKYRGNGFEILGVALDEKGFEIVDLFLAEFDINYPVVVDDYSFGEKLGGIYMLPTTFIADRDGNIVFRKIGEITLDDILPKIQPLL